MEGQKVLQSVDGEYDDVDDAESKRWIEKLDLPPDEHMLDQFSCAVLRKILMHGRLLVFTSHIGFYSRIFNVKLVWPLSMIASAQRRSAGLKLQLRLRDGSNITFASFPAGRRSLAEKLINSLVVYGAVDQASEATIADTPPESDAGTAAAPVAAAAAVPGAAAAVAPAPIAAAAPPAPGAPAEAAVERAPDTPAAATAGAPPDASVQQPSGAQIPAELAAQEPLLPAAAAAQVPRRSAQPAPTKVLPVRLCTHAFGKKFDERTQLVERSVPCTSTREVLAFLVRHSRDVLIACHNALGDENVVVGEWTRLQVPSPMQSPSAGAPVTYLVREASYVRALGSLVGPKKTRVMQRQFLWMLPRTAAPRHDKHGGADAGDREDADADADGGLVLEAETRSLDVPGADSFRVETYFVFTPYGEPSDSEPTLESAADGEAAASPPPGSASVGVKIRAGVAVNFVKRTILRAAIESNSLSRMRRVTPTMVNAYAAGLRRFAADDSDVDTLAFAEASLQLEEPADTERDGAAAAGGAYSGSSDDDDDDDSSDDDDDDKGTDGGEGGGALLWAQDDDVHDNVHGDMRDKAKQVAQLSIPHGVKEVYNALMPKEQSERVYGRFFESGSEVDWKLGDWKVPAPGQLRTRTLTYRRQVSVAMINKMCPIEETHFISFNSAGGFVYEVEVYSPEVPSGGSFRVESYFNFTPSGDDKTEVTSSVAVRWMGKCMYKRMVENGTVSDTSESHPRFLAIMKEMADEFAEGRQHQASRKEKKARAGAKKAAGGAGAAAAAAAGGDGSAARDGVQSANDQKRAEASSSSSSSAAEGDAAPSESLKADSAGSESPQGAVREAVGGAAERLSGKAGDKSSLLLNVVLLAAVFVLLFMLLSTARLIRSLQREVGLITDLLKRSAAAGSSSLSSIVGTPAPSPEMVPAALST